MSSARVLRSAGLKPQAQSQCGATLGAAQADFALVAANLCPPQAEPKVVSPANLTSPCSGALRGGISASSFDEAVLSHLREGRLVERPLDAEVRDLEVRVLEVGVLEVRDLEAVRFV
jgi:hypothetical protein